MMTNKATQTQTGGSNLDLSLDESQSFDELFAQLAMTRAYYEDLRARNGSLRARADALQRLHELRSQLAALREGG